MSGVCCSRLTQEGVTDKTAGQTDGQTDAVTDCQLRSDPFSQPACATHKHFFQIFVSEKQILVQNPSLYPAVITMVILFFLFQKHTQSTEAIYRKLLSLSWFQASPCSPTPHTLIRITIIVQKYGVFYGTFSHSFRTYDCCKPVLINKLLLINWHGWLLKNKDRGVYDTTFQEPTQSHISHLLFLAISIHSNYK